MSLRSTLKLIEDNLDSIQVRVQLHETDRGVIIVAKNTIDRLLAKQELNRQGIPIANSFGVEP